MEILHDLVNNIASYAVGLKPDPRVREWLLMESLVWTIIISIFYLIFSKFIGPQLMKNRKPFDLKNTIIFYNVVQIVLNLYLIVECILSTQIVDGYCTYTDFSDNPEAIRQARLWHLYFLVKVFDLVDTLFFVLRKKFNHISLLHLYHHAIMPPTTWIMVKYWGGSFISSAVAVNCFVHVAVYGYYLLAAMGPRFQKYLWWKKQLTLIQLVQFVLGMIFLYNMHTKCNYPPVIEIGCLINISFQFILFSKFYFQSYIKTEKVEKKS